MNNNTRLIFDAVETILRQQNGHPKIVKAALEFLLLGQPKLFEGDYPDHPIISQAVKIRMNCRLIMTISLNAAPMFMLDPTEWNHEEKVRDGNGKFVYRRYTNDFPIRDSYEYIASRPESWVSLVMEPISSK